MKILKRYILAQFLKTYLLMVVAMVGVFLVIDAFERLDEFVTKHGTFWDFVLYFIYKIPFILSYMAPQAILLATVVTLVGLARNNELTAMRACGISLTGITQPILSTSLIIALGLVFLNEFVTPKTSENMNYIFYVKVRGHENLHQASHQNLWLRSPNGSIWNMETFDPVNNVMYDVSLFYYDREHPVMRQRIDAQKVSWTGDQWVFEKGAMRFFSPGGLDKTQFFETQVFPVMEKPEDFNKVQKRPEEMSAREMYQNILIKESEGFDTARNRVDLHHKLSYPFISVVLALVGIPLSIRSSRRGGLLFCIGISLAIGFLFFFFYATSISLGQKGTFEPVLAAWGPCLLFITVGLYLLLTLDSEKVLPI
ncbi:LPS export ABC transporter permease LptG [Nitrospina sp. 32_T5]|uniref:LPS export ABC transporter permease LptG n=1 Tax=unclassified Nitrospina TaxID=2638683 RepID=UPI003F9534DE